MRALLVASFLLFAPSSTSAAAQEAAVATRGPLFVRREGAVQIDEGQVDRDEVFAAIPVRFRQVARLESEVFENSPLVLGYHGLPAGAPLFAATFVNDLPAASAREASVRGSAWCGIALEGGTLCLFGSGERATIFMAGDNYAPHRMAHEPYPASNLSVVVDPAAEQDLPELEMVYQFRRWTRREGRVKISVRAQGTLSFLEERRLRRADDGSITVAVGGGLVRLTEVAEDRAAVTIVRPPPTRAADETSATIESEPNQ